MSVFRAMVGIRSHSCRTVWMTMFRKKPLRELLMHSLNFEEPGFKADPSIESVETEDMLTIQIPKYQFTNKYTCPYF